VKTALLLALASASVLNTACHAEKGHPTGTRVTDGKEIAPGVRQIGYIEDNRITESSGVVASRQFPGVFWTHNDGPKSYTLFGINRQGKSLASFQLAGAFIHDWEDIAIDSDRHLYVADIGNNDARRFSLWVHEINEPDPKMSGGSVRVLRSWELTFPEKPFDCETLFVWKGFGYVVSKVFNNERGAIYRFPLTTPKGPVKLEFWAQLRIDSPITGGDMSIDGKLLGLVAKSGAFVYQIDGHVQKAGKVKPVHTRFKHEHIEGCCFVPDGLLATAESREMFLFTDPAFHPGN